MEVLHWTFWWLGEQHLGDTLWRVDGGVCLLMVQRASATTASTCFHWDVVPKINSSFKFWCYSYLHTTNSYPWQRKDNNNGEIFNKIFTNQYMSHERPLLPRHAIASGPHAHHCPSSTVVLKMLLHYVLVNTSKCLKHQSENQKIMLSSGSDWKTGSNNKI